MTRAAYEHGLATGRLWAERDIADGLATDSEADALRRGATSLLRNVPRSQAGRRYIAEELGACRGYRQALADFERGRLAREMFDRMPL